MEAIAALSLACNVLQVADAAKTAIDLIGQVYRNGTSVDNAHLEEVTRNLQTLKLDATATEPQLQQIARSCSKIASELLDELSHLNSASIGVNKRNALRRGLRAMRKKAALEKLEAKLADHERTLNTGLLIRLKEQNDAMAITQTSDFAAMDQKLRQFIINLANGHTHIETVLRAEGQSTREHVTSEHAKTRAQLDSAYLRDSTAQHRQRLLSSLKHSSMNARRNQISNHFPQTFEWVFAREKRWSSFPDWLENSDKIYFVEGKAASGKSTLMKFVLADPRTRAFLASWNSCAKVLSHFFWIPGDASQRNLHGMLASLVHQILVEDDALLIASIDTNRDYPSDWSVMELSALLKRCTTSNHYCIFVDGLDEFQDDDNNNNPQVLLDLISDFTSLANLKWCLSSRPEQSILQRFVNTPRLRLQDLTEVDIRLYVVSRLDEAYDQGQLVDRKDHERIVNDIVWYASGVFLWVHLALNSVLRGLQNHATMEELSRRILHLPQDIDKLYSDMLQRLGDDQSVLLSEAAIYFNLCMAQYPDTQVWHSSATLCQYATMAHQSKCVSCGAATGDACFEDAASFAKEMERIRTRIAVVCAGLLEVEPTLTLELEREYGIDYNLDFLNIRGIADTHVQFSHRTARDFIVNQPTGQSILQGFKLTSIQLIRNKFEADFYLLRCMNMHLRGDVLVYYLNTIKSMREEGYLDSQTICEMLRLIRARQVSLLNRLSNIDGKSTALEVNSCMESDTTIKFELEPPHELGEGFVSRILAEVYASFDFLGLTLETCLPEYFDSIVRLYFADGQGWNTITQQYLNYLLLCASKTLFGPSKPAAMRSIHDTLIKAGAEPDAELYLPFWHPVRRCASVTRLLGPGAIPFGSTKLSNDSMSRHALIFYRYPHNLRTATTRFLVDGKNYTFLMDIDLPPTVPETGIIDPDGIQDPQRGSYWKYWLGLKKKVLAVEEDAHTFVTTVSEQDSQTLLPFIEDSIRKFYEAEEGKKESYKIPALAVRKIADRIWQESNSKIPSDDFLKDLGCLKDPSDPAVIKVPIKRFKDGVDTSNMASW